MSNERQHVKAALEAAHAEIGKAIARVDRANGEELAELRVGAKNLAAFVDFNKNGSCAGPTSSELLSRLRG